MRSLGRDVNILSCLPSSFWLPVGQCQPGLYLISVGTFRQGTISAGKLKGHAYRNPPARRNYMIIEQGKLNKGGMDHQKNQGFGKITARKGTTEILHLR